MPWVSLDTLVAVVSARTRCRRGTRILRHANALHTIPVLARHSATSAATSQKTKWAGLDTKGRFQGEFTPKVDAAFISKRLVKWERLWSRSQEELKARERQPIEIVLPDGSVKEGVRWETVPLDIAASISKRLAADAIVALVDYCSPLEATNVNCVAADAEEDDDGEKVDENKGQLYDLTRPLEGSCRLEFLNFNDLRGQDTFWHSSSHMLGAALEANYGGLLTIGPALTDGFYYDMFLGSTRLSEVDFPAIEKSVEELKQMSEPFLRMVLSREDALDLFEDNPFKVDLISRKVAPGSTTTAYRCGPFIDLCRGPHLPSTSRVKAFSITKNSSAYWLGKAENDSLQRIYGISFPTGKQLKEHQRRVEQARERDHRRIGKQQDLFFFTATTSPGSGFWTGYGSRIYNRLCDLLRAEYRARGFEEVITPNIYSSEVFKRSGHYQNYREDMYGFKVEGQEWFLKPMNCPGHCVIFESRPRSYRELPIRLADFGVLHRNELSGTLSGLTRVRRFQQDDAHIFCREDQIRDEVAAALRFISDIYELLGFEYKFFLSTRPKKALGSEKLWQRAEMQLQEALDDTGSAYGVKKGDGAFYGPKIDVELNDALGRGHQCGTVQLDFQLPLRFNLRYQIERAQLEASKTGLTPTCGDEASLPVGFARPVILHRAILGSVERMVAVLCEHYGGKWPFWLSPRQCMIVPVSEDAYEYACYVRDALRSRGLFSEVDLGSGTLKKKVREAQVAQWNYIMVVGKSEEEKMEVNLRARGSSKPLGNRKLADLIEQFEVESKPRFLARPGRLEPFRHVHL